ncbi:MAG: hypothetical protein FWD71_10995 [Oscillospiraceae bacterium]|nr:hypothetical protein [Oscillospiraceae bacterium]
MDIKVKSVKTRNNAVLKEFIIGKYGSISKFTRKEKVSRGDLEVILHKADIFTEMNIGMKVCKALNIDAEELFFKGNIISKTDDSFNSINNTYDNMPLEEIIRAKCLKLGTEEQQKILDFINNILEN